MLVTDQEKWKPLKEILKQFALDAKHSFKYLPNQGNPGDALIAAGTWQLFDDIQIAPRYCSLKGIRTGDSVLYGGGGNLVPAYHNCRDFLERCLEINIAHALVLPQSIDGHTALLKRLDQRFTLVCRDAASLERVQATGTQAKVLFAPDLALYVDTQRLFERTSVYKGLRLRMVFVRNGRRLAYRRWEVALKRSRPLMQGEVDIFRTDSEATNMHYAEPRKDIPSFYGSPFNSRAESDILSRDFLSLFSQVRKVRTNRLHVGIAAALMGCEVTFLDNAYGKIGAVYKAWLTQVPHIRFESHAPRKLKFSLVMGTLGRTDDVRRFLASLQRQDYRHFELFIIDQNEDDRLLPMIEEYQQHYPIQRVVSAKGLSRARNAALPLVTGDLVAFPDDDCWYPEGLLSAVAARFESEVRMLGLTGRFVDHEGRAEGHWLTESQRLTQYTVWRGAISFTIFLRRTLVERIGHFDEQLGVGAGTPWGAGEETDYLLRGLKLGACIYFDHGLVLHHPVKIGTFDDAALRRQTSYEAGFGRVIRRAGFPFWYFPYHCLRSAAGVVLAISKRQGRIAQFKWQGLLARIRGWLSGANVRA